MTCIQPWRLAILSLVVCALPSLAHAAFVVDSGTPDGSSNRSIFWDNATAGQFAAQEFTLAADTLVQEIEVYLGGSAANDDYHIYLTTEIGGAATAADVVDDFFAAPPGTGPSDGVWVGLLNGNLNLLAGTYYLVFATDVADTGGGFLPIDAPNDIGQAFLVSGASIDFTEPYASSFFGTSSVTSFGVRLTEVPEPATIALVTCVGLALAIRRR